MGSNGKGRGGAGGGGAGARGEFSEGNKVFTGPGRGQALPNNAEMVTGREARQMARRFEKRGRGMARDAVAREFRAGSFPMSTGDFVGSGIMATFTKGASVEGRNTILAKAVRGTVYEWHKLPDNAYGDRYLYVLSLRKV